MSEGRSKPFELTGILATSDTHGRLRLCLVDRLEAREGALDNSWKLLTTVAPPVGGYAVPYKLDAGGTPDDAGVRGECWVSLPKSRKKGERERLAAFVEELKGREVAMTVRPQRYSFVSKAAHNYGAKVTGTSLTFVGGLEALAPTDTPTETRQN